MENGISSNYACQNWCDSNYHSSYLSPVNSQLEAGETTTFNVFQQDYDHYGILTGYYLRIQILHGSTYWSSNTTSVATINSSSALASAIAPGTTTLTATWQDYTAPEYTMCEPFFAEDGKREDDSKSDDPRMLGSPETCDACLSYTVFPTPSVALTVPPTVTGITSDSGTYKITNILGNQNLAHFVTPKGTGDITLTATLSENTPEVLNDISWEDATESATDARIATLSRGTASKKVVKLKYKGKTIKELRVWVVWATITVTNTWPIVPNPTPTPPAINQTGNPAGAAHGIEGGYDFKHTIQPSSIITDTDRPDFCGNPDPLACVSNLNSPPGTNHPINGSPLSGGANKKWDASRQIRLKILNPNSISASDTSFVTSFPSDSTSYPTNDVEGNDDRNQGDEIIEPYTSANSGLLLAQDIPPTAICDRAGANGDTFESRLHFRQFARLEIEGTWYRISDFFLWRFHRKMKKTAGIWVNDGSILAQDNEGF